MARIFLSYAHEDQAAAKRIVDALAREGLEAWWDHDIPPGRTWDEMIGARIDSADIVIVLWSKRSIASNFVKEEAQIALDAGKLLPLKIDDVEPPIGFRRLQAANLSGWRDDPGHGQWRVALSEIQRRLGDAPAPRVAPRRRSIRLAALGVVVLAAAGLFAAATNVPAPRHIRVAVEPANREPAPASAPEAPVNAPRPAAPPRAAVDSVAHTLWQGPVFRSSGRASEWAVRFNEDGTAALDFMDGRGFIDSGDWVWTQDGRSVRLIHRPSGNYAEATIHDREMSGVLTTPTSPRDNGTFRFMRR